MSLSQQKNRYRATESEEGGEEWLTTYGDTITLLMSFFLLLISVSKVDPVLFEMMKKGLRQEITNEDVKTPLAEIKHDLDSLLTQERNDKKVAVILGPKGIVMEFASEAFYQPGNAEMSKMATGIIDKVTQAIQNIDYCRFSVDIEGHTDNVPINTLRFPSNWELSVSRATNIVKYMIEKGLESDRLKAAGYADTKPAAPNLDEKGKPIPQNQAKNRRIVINIH
ncbi:MAG: flagellar motor protein MotB [Fibrobacteria bacterium]|nr:flagellar motor protein MotB [Fibrobacteria bacterium]